MLCKRCKHQGRPVSLDQCLQHFISSETIKEVECENCTKLQGGSRDKGHFLENQRTTFIKQLKLGKLPQCLCIHLQRLTWSNEGTPMKRQEHVYFTEFLSMDRYKHNASIQRTQQHTKRSPTPTDTETLGDPEGKPVHNGTGMVVVTSTHQNNNKPLANGSCSSIHQFIHSPGMRPQFNLPHDYSGRGKRHCVAHAFLSNMCSRLQSTEYLFQLTRRAGAPWRHALWTLHHLPPLPPPCAGTPPPSGSGCRTDSVRKASLQEALSSNAYLIFYERVQRLSLAFQAEE
ncbi:hypothetical protein CRUP_014330 [Coryphaenoides rupestris]|nr:hypothetical protein CRUP_014330 [Coryphaenoides rupestris]